MQSIELCTMELLTRQVGLNFWIKQKIHFWRFSKCRVRTVISFSHVWNSLGRIWFSLENVFHGRIQGRILKHGRICKGELFRGESHSVCTSAQGRTLKENFPREILRENVKAWENSQRSIIQGRMEFSRENWNLLKPAKGSKLLAEPFALTVGRSWTNATSGTEWSQMIHCSLT